jgi:drug/metabolite transporter (DMT)-like permease
MMVVSGPESILIDFGNVDFQQFALLMGAVYYLELVFWFYAVRHIDISVASSIAVPAPALTMVFAILFLNEDVETYQIVALFCVIASVYGLIFSGNRKHRAKTANP